MNFKPKLLKLIVAIVFGIGAGLSFVGARGVELMILSFLIIYVIWSLLDKSN